ncbi:hypothetical protein BD626DRAFT_480788 [Schizophyllum amplum]|uniref:DUF4050 domain-containing protein n=1 Tax=Schizophyllum amplum TaxID=97359 RepID=A0A550CTI5_9AGAR|nr:hypothetical protein BD626DRAFT_480788 [Auriculariopsis ampla]
MANESWQAQLNAAYASSPAAGSPPHVPAVTADTFEEVLRRTPMPPPGPEYYAARRALWNSDWKASESREPRTLPAATNARRRLEEQTASPDVIYNDQVWATNLQKIWKSLGSGDRFKYPMPLRVVVRIAQASWLRDNIWPPGMVVVSSSDEEAGAPTFTFAETSTEHPSGSTTAVVESEEVKDESMIS